MKPLFLLGLLFVSVSVFSQNRFFKKGEKAFLEKNYKKALTYYLKSEIQEDSTTTTCTRIAYCYLFMRNYKKSNDYFSMVAPEDLKKEDIEKLAILKQNLEDYPSASRLYSILLTKEPDNRLLRTRQRSCEWISYNSRFYNHKIEPLTILNSMQSFGVQFFKDGIVYSGYTNYGLGNTQNDSFAQCYTDLYYGELRGNKAVNLRPFSENIIFPYHEGNACFNSNYTQIYFSVVEKTALKTIVINIYQAQFERGHWRSAKKMAFCSDSYSCVQPAISPSGDTLVFSSNMEGGEGGKDLYAVYKTPNGWSTPENLGSDINTQGDELFPFFDSQGKLYFSSNGHFGYGGQDIYWAVVKNKKWVVCNMNQPINSSKDDFGFVIHLQNPQLALFSSNRLGDGTKDVAFLVKLDTLRIVNSKNSAKKIITKSYNQDKLTFKVQFKSSKQCFFQEKELLGQKVERYFYKNLYRYTVGEFNNFEEAEKLCHELKQNYSESFVVTFRNKRRVSIKINENDIE